MKLFSRQLYVLLLFLLSSVTSFATAQTVRFASFNTAFSDAFGIDASGRLASHLATTDFQNAQVVAEIIQRVRPNVILLNEFDTDLSGDSYAAFQQNYLSVSQSGADPIQYDHVFVAESNTGIRSGVDFNNNNSTNNPDDSFGFGNYAGEFGMVVLSQFPIVTADARTFQQFLWKDMPDNALPTDYYSDEAEAVFRLSSKSHWDLPIQIAGETVHFLAAHPTPPVFDGPEDRNGRRNHDEIRFWADYINAGASGYIYDDGGDTGGLPAGAKFVIAGDYNADPFDGDSFNNAISQLLDNPRVNTLLTPSSDGAVEDSATEGGRNDTHRGDPAFDTSDFNPSTVGNLRVDYILPSSNLTFADTAVFWPEQSSDLGRLTPNFPDTISDHRLVWADIVVPEPSGSLLLLLALVSGLRSRTRIVMDAGQRTLII